ncbi:hypothetical protein [Nostoc sp.]|uniref:hypothetical protein n=1 Tax=Nostoc sp. TaxID=1180 RepID=UPI002FF71A6E
MDTILTADDLFDIRDHMGRFGRQLDTFRISNSTKLSASTLSTLEKSSSSIKQIVSKLTTEGMNKLTTDLKEPATNIKKAIKKLEDALETIETFNKVENYIAGIINVFGKIVEAFSQRLGSANIASAFDSLKDLFSVV